MRTSAGSDKVMQTCSVGSCERLTRREDGLCAFHAETARARAEARSGVSSVTSIIEAKIVSFAEETAKPVGGGGPASETYTVYRINMLHWDFTCMELYEWKLAKRFRLFDKLRRDMVAAHGSVAACPGM